jgi:hypothetical protein
VLCLMIVGIYSPVRRTELSPFDVTDPVAGSAGSH